MVKVGNTSQGDTSTRSQKSAQKVRVDASTLTSTGSTRRSMDTRASGTLSSSGLSSISRSQKLTQFQQPAPTRQPYQVQPSPRARQNTPGHQSPHVRISSVSTLPLLCLCSQAVSIFLVSWCEILFYLMPLTTDVRRNVSVAVACICFWILQWQTCTFCDKTYNLLDTVEKNKENVLAKRGQEKDTK